MLEEARARMGTLQPLLSRAQLDADLAQGAQHGRLEATRQQFEALLPHTPVGYHAAAPRRGRGRALRSATKSAIVTSVSWPMPATTGRAQRAKARATRSSLNAHRSSSEPPPRASISTSHSARAEARSSAATMAGAAAAPCTGAG